MAQHNAPQKLTDLLIAKNFDVKSLDSAGQPATDPAQAKVFNFNWVAESGKDYGTVVATIGENNDLTVYTGDNVGKSMEGDDKNEWFKFLEQLRMFAKKNLMTFSAQNLNKLKYSQQGQAAMKEGLRESWMGRKDRSWSGVATEARLMIKHKRVIGEGEARFRYIESLFIETADGERFKLPFTKLSAGKAMLEHVRQGGRPYDPRGNHIATIVAEMNLLARFRRANAGKIFEGQAAALVEQADHHLATLQHTIKSLSTKTGYTKYFEAWDPTALTDEDVIIEDLRCMFVEQNIDSRIEQALPLLAKLQKQEDAMKEIGIFEGWINCLSEGTWALPDTPEKQQKLIALLADELPVGPDGTNATEQLYDLIGNDDLFDQLQDLAREDANADARTIVINFLERMSSDPSVAQVIGKLKIEKAAPPAEAPPAEPVAEAVLCETCNEAVCECGQYESINESIERIAELSGTGMQRVFKNGQWVKPEPKPAPKPVNELSSDTLKNYIKKAGSSSHEQSASNLASRAADKLANAHLGDSGEDDGSWDDEKSYIRSKGIARAVDRLEEGGPVDADAARELVLTAYNDNDLYRQSYDPIIKNLQKKVAKGVYDTEMAKKLWGYHADRAAQKYAKEQGDGTPWNKMFSPATRRAAAEQFEQEAREEIGADQVNEISDQTVQNYKDKAWDEFARGNDKRGAGIGRALDKQRGAFGHVKTTNQKTMKESPVDIEVAIRNEKYSEEESDFIMRVLKANRGQVGKPGDKRQGFEFDTMDDARSFAASLPGKCDAVIFVDGQSLDEEQVKATGQDKQLDENDVAQRVDSLNFEMMDLLDQADSATPEEKAVLKQKFQAAKKERNELLGGTLADSPKGKLDELSPKTLGSYIKKASKDATISRKIAGDFENRAKAAKKPDMKSANASVANDFRTKSFRRQDNVDRAVDRIAKEETDTVTIDPKTGKPSSWSHDGDWKKIPKRGGKPVDPRGEVTNMAGRELKRAQQIASLKESGMGEVDLTLQEIARGNVDIYDIYANPKTQVEKFVSDQIHEKIDEITFERGLHPKDDIEKILEIIQDDIARDYGIDEGSNYPHPNTTQDHERVQPKYFGEDETEESAGGGNWLEETTALTGQYGHSGKLQAVQGTNADMMDRIRFLAGITK
jgi:hypothetical protein